MVVIIQIPPCGVHPVYTFGQFAIDSANCTTVNLAQDSPGMLDRYRRQKLV